MLQIQSFGHKHKRSPCNLRERCQFSCSYCERLVWGSAYCCIPCELLKHKSCEEMPQEVQHSFHPEQPLTIHYTGNFKCIPLSRVVKHKCHEHPLTLTYSVVERGVGEMEECNYIECAIIEVDNPTCDPREEGFKYMSVLHHAMCIEGHKAVEAGVNGMDLQKGFISHLRQSRNTYGAEHE